jgi:type I restriction enzyme M protein
MLPMTVLRRFDCVLEPTKEAVLKKYESIKDGKVKNVDSILNRTAGDGKDIGFHNHSQLDFQRLKGNPENIANHLADYIAGVSENVREIFGHFNFEAEIEKLEEANRLYMVVAKFADIDLSPEIG